MKQEGQAQGTVIELLPNTLFRITLDETNEEFLAYLAGKMKINRIKILVGDRVSLVLDKYGGRARIVKRL